MPWRLTGPPWSCTAPWLTALEHTHTPLSVLPPCLPHPQAVAEAKEKFRPTLMANYMLWPAANLINFAFVPPSQRILYCNVIYVSARQAAASTPPACPLLFLAAAFASAAAG